LSTHIDCYYSQYHIRSNYITTGWTPTEGEIALRESQGMSIEELRSFASRLIPAGRMQEVADYIPVVLFLLSDYAAMVSGANIRMTGGLYL
jgi:NAD(P)-dependent dehydrogenase (short-subunit alcohol dehydrogenase family)